MISVSIPLGSFPELPRRDLMAIFPYLNRKEFEAKGPRDQMAHVEGVLQRLANASRMQ
jgi:hypothetical protein